MKKTFLKVLTIVLAAAFTAVLAACPEEQETESGDIDSSLYGTWRNDNDTLIITFSSGGITWGGAVGNAFNNLPSGTKWTAKNGKISHVYSGTTTKAYDYTISSGNLILTSISGATYTLTKDGGSSGGGTGNNDIDSSLYGTWRNDNDTLIITFSSGGITWGGTVGNAFNNLPSGTKWTAKNGAISHIYSGTTTKAYDYSIDSSGKLILTSISGAEYTLTRYYKTFGDFRYTEDGLTITITGYTGYYGGTVNIPSTIDGKPVVSIGGKAFESKGLTSVTIPNSVTSIGEAAFNGNQLTSVTIPNSVTSIGDYAFYSNQLASITIPNSVTTIGYGAFEYNQLTSVTIPNSVTTIGDYAFYSNQLASITIPNSVTTIGEAAFAGEYHPGATSNNELTSVTIGNSVISIGERAFYNNQLTSVIIPDSVTNIGIWAFANNELTSVTIGNSVTSIGSFAFCDNQLTNVIIPNSVTNIMYAAFTGNELTSVTIGANVTLGYDSSYQHHYGGSFPGNFDTVYDNGGKQAGKYTCPTAGNNSVWTKQN